MTQTARSSAPVGWHLSDVYDCFAATAPGLAPLVARELSELEIQPTAVELDGVSFQAPAASLYAANLWLRTASRVLVRVAGFHASEFHELERGARRVTWDRFIGRDTPVTARVTCHKSRLYHSDAVAERIVRAIHQSVANDATAAEDVPRQLVVVRMVHDMCTISVDASGELLHRRGYRHAAAKAPLRETLAAALLLASGWDGIGPLIDPMCGAGTIAIEAALLARHRAPGLGRSFAFERWPELDGDAWCTALATAREQERPSPRVVIHASDRDAGATTAAQANADRASVADAIEITTRAISAIAPPAGPGWLVTNPPYGVRVGDRDRLRNLYAQLGNVARAKCPGWTVAFLSADRALTRQTQLPLTAHLRTTNGGIPIEAVVGRVPG